MKAIPSTLKIYWEDGVTVEMRYFPSIRKAKKYAQLFSGYRRYIIERDK